MDSKVFETIYVCYNPDVGIEKPLDNSLEKSLETKKLFEDIYFECNMKPLSEHVLREMPQEPVNNYNDINGYKHERLGQYGDQRYKYFNKPNQSREDFIKEIDIEIQKAKNRNNSFNTIRVYNDNNKKETIGYITYSIEKNYLICTILNI